MARTPSTMLPLGTPAPSFSLPDTEGSTVTLEEFRDAPALVVMFVCNHCPFVKHIAEELARFGRDAILKGVGVVAISSNDVESHPQDSPEMMAKAKAEWDWPFPYLHDATQEVAKAYRAACTPDFYVFDGDGVLVYRGQFDDSRPGNDVPVTGRDLREAVNAVLRGDEVSQDQTPSIGCNIKWTPGREPEYARG
ncbi:MAG: thioredoxin family protein [Gemmatimonadales bacterium]|nr:MAG: thioredoxin family protein [Gemmatimonadales bacterium]